MFKIYNNTVLPILCEGWHFTHVWVHKTSSTPPLFIEMPVPSQESEWSWVYVKDIEFSFFYDFSIALGIVPTVWYFFNFSLYYRFQDIKRGCWQNETNTQFRFC